MTSSLSLLNGEINILEVDILEKELLFTTFKKEMDSWTIF